MMIIMYFVGLLTGLGIWFIAHWVKSEPRIEAKRSATRHRLAGQGQQPIPPRSVMPPLKKPKKCTGVDYWNDSIPLSRPTPPKPPHNPHK